VADSLVIGSIIELLGGGVASTHPLCAGAMFRLAPGWDLSAPQPSGGTVASLLLGGGLPVGQHIDNRQPSLPVVIVVPSTGNLTADRATLAGAREVLAQAVNADRWQMVWTRDGSGLPLVFDCFHAKPVVRSYSEPHDLGLVSQMQVSFEALPYGRSDTAESVTFNSPASGWQPPPSPVVIDGYATVSSSTGASSWTRSTTQVAAGTGSARWVRQSHAAPLYTTTLAAALDITGRRKMSLWAGLGTASYSQWHTGRVTCSVTLTDATGNTVTCTITFTGHASALPGVPRWQKISGLIPQVPFFDYTTVSSYQLQMWNRIEAVPGATGGTAPVQPVLQADCYLDTLRADSTSTGAYGTRGTLYSLPGVTGTAPAPLTVQVQPGPSAAPQTALFTTGGSNNWTAPAGVTNVQQVEALAAGAGGRQAGGLGGGGGGGGEHVMDYNVAVTPATVYHPTVGAPGSGGTTGGVNPTDGGDSFFTGDAGRTVRAHGGKAAGPASNQGGLGGTGSTAPLHLDGGDGYTTPTRDGGGGGGGGGQVVNGSDGSGRTGGAGVDGGGPGGPGGHADDTNAGKRGGGAPPGGTYGGGGGGGGLNVGGTQYGGGAGRGGWIRLNWSATAGSPLKTTVLHLPARDSPHSIAPLIAAGNGTDVPNGSTVYTAPVTGALQARYYGTYQALLTVSSWNTPANPRTVTVTLRQLRGDGTTVTQAMTRTTTPNTDPDPLRVLNGLLLLGTVTLPLTRISPGNNTDVFSLTVSDTNTSDRFLDLLLLDASGQTVIYSASGSGVANLWVTEPDTGLDYGQVYGSAADWDTADSVLGDCPVMAGGPLAVMPGENPLLVYSAQGAPGVIASYQPRWNLDRLQ
jgi:hypothetical protein